VKVNVKCIKLVRAIKSNPHPAQEPLVSRNSDLYLFTDNYAVALCAVTLTANVLHQRHSITEFSSSCGNIISSITNRNHRSVRSYIQHRILAVATVQSAEIMGMILVPSAFSAETTIKFAFLSLIENYGEK
jgi:hypothetical protein